MEENKESNFEKEMKNDMLNSLDSSCSELEILLKPVFHDKIKHVNGKLLKDCFKHIKNILLMHQNLRRDL